MLALVAVAAAIAGWVAVRAVHRPSVPRVAPATTATGGDSPAGQDLAAEDDGAVEPSRHAGGTTAPAKAADEPADESERIERDLTTLSLALRETIRPEDLVMPRVNDALEVPAAIRWLRAPDFWEPVLNTEAERRR